MFQKSLAPILIILLLAVVIGGYLIGTGKINLSQKQIEQSATSKVDETASWKTYTNNVYKFSFKYPPSDLVYKCGGEPTNKVNEISGPADGTEKECVSINHKSANSGWTPTIRIDVIKESYIDHFTNDKIKNKKQTLTTISGKRAYITFLEVSEGNTEKSKQVVIEQSPTETIWLNGLYDDPISIALFNTIFPTFKFTQ